MMYEEKIAIVKDISLNVKFNPLPPPPRGKGMGLRIDCPYFT